VSLFGRLSDATAVLLGRSAYQMPPLDQSTTGLDDPRVEETRRRMGGQLALPTVTQTRWYLADLERAELNADAGWLEDAARLMTAARKDGVLSGVLSTRTSGLVRLPKKFRGDPDVIADLELGHGQVRSVFDEMYPPTELALLAADGECLGVGVGELVPVEGRDYPVFVRLAPEFLVYRWVENRWYYRSIAGLIPITPGDGRWILHAPGGRMTPWQHGLWRALGRAYIRKEHASLNKDNWESKLANPARVAVAPAGGAEAQQDAWFKQVMAWGINTVFSLRPGYDVRLLESNGRGWESFNKTIEAANNEITIAIAGQTVTTDGGAGFQNSDIHKTIRADLIKATADGLAYTINTQGIPAFIALRYGVDAVESKGVVVEWDVTPPKDRNSEATSMVTAANAITLLTAAAAPYGVTIDIAAIMSRFGIPVAGDQNGDGAPEVTTKESETFDAQTGKARLTLVPGDAVSSDSDDESEAA
jgi:Mu-like prophage protein gp29